MEQSLQVTIIIGVFAIVGAFAIGILTLLSKAREKDSKGQKSHLRMSLALIVVLLIILLILSISLKNNGINIIDVFFPNHAVENTSKPNSTPEIDNSTDITEDQISLNILPQTNCTDLIYNMPPYNNKLVSFFFLNAKKLQVNCSTDVKNYDDRSFSIESKYYDTLIDIEIIAFDSSGNILGKRNINSLYILLNSTVDDIPMNAKAIYVLKAIDNNEFEQLCSNESLLELACLDIDTLSNIDPISKLVNLEYLNLIYCDDISNLDALATLHKLRYLNINNCDSIVSIEAIGMLENLEQLHMNACKSIVDITPLSNLKKLEYSDIKN